MVDLYYGKKPHYKVRWYERGRLCMARDPISEAMTPKRQPHVRFGSMRVSAITFSKVFVSCFSKTLKLDRQ